MKNRGFPHTLQMDQGEALRWGQGLDCAGGRAREEGEKPEHENLGPIQWFAFTVRLVGAIKVIVGGVSCDQIRLMCEEWLGVLMGVSPIFTAALGTPGQQENNARVHGWMGKQGGMYGPENII